MPMYGAGTAIEQVRGFRMCWMPGRFAAGKSALSFMLAGMLADKYGYRIISNQENVWNESEPPEWRFDADGNMTLQLILIADEGGLYFQDNQSVMSFMAFAGKMDIILILPSIQEPAAIMKSLTIQPIYNFRSAGIPVNVLEWRTNVGTSKYSDQFYWVGMEEIYGVYSTLNPSFEAIGISYYLRQKVKEYKDWYLARQKIPSWLERYTMEAMAEETVRSLSARPKKRNGISEVETDRRQIGLLENINSQMEETSRRLETLPVRKTKGNGR